MSQGRSDNDLAAKYESSYQQNRPYWSLQSSWMGTRRRALSIARDVAQSCPQHPSYRLQCITLLLVSSIESPLTSLCLRVNHVSYRFIVIDSMTSVFNTDASLPYNHEATASNARLSAPPPQIIGERNYGNYNHSPCHPKETRGLRYCQVAKALAVGAVKHQHVDRCVLLVSIIRSLCSENSGRLTLYGELSKSFRMQSGARQVCPLSPFLFNFVIDEIMRRTLDGLQNAGVLIVCDEHLVDLEYADDTASLTIQGRALKVVELSTYLGSFVGSDCNITDKGNSRICKAWVTFPTLRHCVKVVYPCISRGSSNWLFRAAELTRLQVLDSRRRTTARVGWCRRIRYEAIRKGVFGCATGTSIEECAQHQKLRWFRHVLCMPNHRLPKSTVLHAQLRVAEAERWPTLDLVEGYEEDYEITLPVPSCHATRRKHEGWDTAGLPKPRQGKSRDRGRVRTTDLPQTSHLKMDDKPPPYGSVMGYQQAAPYPSGHPVQMGPYFAGQPMYGAPYPTGPAAAPYPTSPTMPGAGYSHPYPDPQSQPYGEYSASDGNAFTSSARFSDKSVRHAFIRKVYLILTAQLLVTCGIVSLFLLAATFLVTYITLVCCDNVRRRFPGNFIALSVFTLAFSYVAGTIASFHNTDSVLIAVGITAAVCLGISLFAIQTRIDFTKCTALIFVLSLVVLLTGLACMIVYMVSGPNKILHVVYGGLAALLFGLYLAFDTQMIMGGRKHELSPEEYIYGALQLYLDVVYLFMIILSLVGSKD
ncbi:hypothetical protein T265_06072 [Opisthorchis viverrini]|uniref:Reverse transcriptase domain-containing protein n=1 Tax=Opisthorchis viverrini TaxID=6198 RepID=A0A074ZIA9_OPIVI|nr:hypothetical protein T265_06072 [Opisthorchis viverrini]KER26706.1 hypothetical protein T265_06072 [Opisthorchis viverrini]